MPTVEKEFYTAEEYAAAKNANIASYLQSMGYALEKKGLDFKGKAHDSLTIRGDGRWYWNSRGIGGKSPIELLKQILINDYGYSDEITAAIEAIKRLSSSQGVVMHRIEPRNQSKPAQPKDCIQLPEANKNVSRVMAYLCKTRGLDAEIVTDLIAQKKIYETKDYHNAIFVSYDKENNPRHAFMRGTYSLSENQFKKEVTDSDKSYTFTLPGHQDSDRVFCFEAAIDAISHASIYKRNGQDWKQDYRIALGGTSFLGLNRFLEENPQVKQITVCLDNDPTGLRRGEKLKEEFTQKGYFVDFEYPLSKDFNQDLLNIIAEEQEDEQEF